MPICIIYSRILFLCSYAFIAQFNIQEKFTFHIRRKMLNILFQNLHSLDHTLHGIAKGYHGVAQLIQLETCTVYGNTEHGKEFGSTRLNTI